ncbi:MAG TPA: septal ring lytic transglycosylase RlpA family protein [Candidatus Saccharimonadia bacterium]|nr:septal ring lytic transglycosylase RlpA family protein [Candidatus Saccharimonadia bacterium]
MKAKTKRRIRHVLTKKKLVKRKASKHILRTFLIGLTTISMGSLAYAITLNKPTVSVNVRSSGPGGIEISAPIIAPTPTPAPPGGAPAQTGRSSWYALGLAQPDALTCASRTFPRGTYLQVKDLNNDRTMVCLVNDYGPAIWTGRVIDLSRGSFEQLESLGVGTIPVEIRVSSNTTSFDVPIYTQIKAAVVGYSLCDATHSAQYCNQHRQD